MEESSFGLYYYGARWYDTALGRFVQADTIVPDGVQGLDRYAYANNNPVKFIDPSGHSFRDPPMWPNGYSIIDMSGWSSLGRFAASLVLAATIDNLTYGRTGVYGDNTWGIIPDSQYINSGSWMVPPVFGGVVSSADDIAKIGFNIVNNSSNRLNSRNFRINLQILTGADLSDIAGKEAHHVLPQQFIELFEKIGIDINDPRFGTWVDAISHRKWSWEYNQRWKEFFTMYDNNPTVAQVEEFAKELAEEYEFKIYFTIDVNDDK